IASGGGRLFGVPFTRPPVFGKPFGRGTAIYSVYLPFQFQRSSIYKSSIQYQSSARGEDDLPLCHFAGSGARGAVTGKHSASRRFSVSNRSAASALHARC